MTIKGVSLSSSTAVAYRVAIVRARSIKRRRKCAASPHSPQGRRRDTDLAARTGTSSPTCTSSREGSPTARRSLVLPSARRAIHRASSRRRASADSADAPPQRGPSKAHVLRFCAPLGSSRGKWAPPCSKSSTVPRQGKCYRIHFNPSKKRSSKCAASVSAVTRAVCSWSSPIDNVPARSEQHSERPPVVHECRDVGFAAIRALRRLYVHPRLNGAHLISRCCSSIKRCPQRVSR